MIILSEICVLLLSFYSRSDSKNLRVMAKLEIQTISKRHLKLFHPLKVPLFDILIPFIAQNLTAYCTCLDFFTEILFWPFSRQ